MTEAGPRTETVERTVSGVKLRFTVRHESWGLSLSCEGDDQGYEPLWRVLEAAWSPTVHRFLDAVAQRHGTSWEGVVSFAYAEDHPDERIPQGSVRCFYFDEVLDVTERFFRAGAAAACCATLEAAAKMGLEPKDAAAMREFVAKTPP